MNTPATNYRQFAALVLFSVQLFTISAVASDNKVRPATTRPSSKGLQTLPPLAHKINGKWRFEVPMAQTAGVGYMEGDGIIESSGFFALLSLELAPGIQLKKRLLRIGMNVSYDSRETIGFSLAERHVHGGPDFRLRLGTKWDVGLTSDGGYCFRPNWPDSYQPVVTVNDLTGEQQRSGKLHGSDRNSYFHIGTDTYIKYRFTRRLSVEVYGGYDFKGYRHDPGYDENEAPTHLVPGDRHRVSGGIQLVGSTPERFWRFTLDTRIEDRRYTRTYARDAKTGYTHASSVTTSPNPLQHFVLLRLRQRNSFKLIDDVLKAVLIGEYTRKNDVYQGYYTTNSFALDIILSWTPTSRLELSVGYDLIYEKYTKDGYQASIDWPTDRHHPPLDNGNTIRDEFTYGATGRAEFATGVTNLHLFLQGDFKKNRTNFPDYEPGVFPRDQQYRINWDYLNWQLLFGVAFKM